MKTRFLPFLLLVLVLTGCAQSVFVRPTPTPEQTTCKVEDVDKAIEDMGLLLTRWMDADAIASSSPRMSLSGPISDLQAIRRDTKALVVPECLESAQIQLTTFMDYALEGYLAFLGDEPDSTVNKAFSDAKTRLESYTDEILRIKACVPDCQY